MFEVARPTGGALSQFRCDYKANPENQRKPLRRRVPDMSLCWNNISVFGSRPHNGMPGSARGARCGGDVQPSREAAARLSSVVAAPPGPPRATALLKRRWGARGAGQASRAPQKAGAAEKPAFNLNPWCSRHGLVPTAGAARCEMYAARFEFGITGTEKQLTT